MTHIEKRIVVDVPIRMAYDQWTQFESFPTFMAGIRGVRQLDDTTLYWVAAIAGHEIEWIAEITHQEPDRHIGWRSTSGAESAGSVKFEPLDLSRTLVTVRLEYSPRGVLEKTASALGLVAYRVEAGLEGFKDFLEVRSRATGAWRGEIRHGQVALP